MRNLDSLERAKVTPSEVISRSTSLDKKVQYENDFGVIVTLNEFIWLAVRKHCVSLALSVTFTINPETRP